MIQSPPKVPLNFPSMGSYKTLFSPNDLLPIAEVQYATEADIKNVLQQLSMFQLKMETISDIGRAQILKNVANLIEENSERLALLIATEGGKPLKDARVEVSRARTTLEVCSEECVRDKSEIVPMNRTSAGQGHQARLLREPIGPVLAISAFNHPLNLLAHQVGCAIASGCAVVLKPAPSTPLCAIEMEHFFRQSGLPEGLLTVINAEIPEIEMLATSSAFSYVTFIGSEKVGWNLRKVIAPGTRLGLELGGQAPAVVASDGDIDQAVKGLIKSSFYHAGQVCISTQKIYVHESVYDQFLALFVKGAKALVTGDARDPVTDVGPLIRISEVERLKCWIEETVSKGAVVACGNLVLDKGQFLTPTILAHVPESSIFMNQEAFGPVVCVNSYKDLDELLKTIKKSPYMFESCIYTNDEKNAQKFVEEMKSMTIMINNHNAFRVDWMPFGGHGLSGLGMGGVRYMMEDMTRLKQVIQKI